MACVVCTRTYVCHVWVYARIPIVCMYVCVCVCSIKYILYTYVRVFGSIILIKFTKKCSCFFLWWNGTLICGFLRWQKYESDSMRNEIRKILGKSDFFCVLQRKWRKVGQSNIHVNYENLVFLCFMKKKLKNLWKYDEKLPFFKSIQ